MAAMDTQQRSSRLATAFVVGVLLVGFYYLAYRYPLRINDAGTSSTYTDTPLVLQVGKYALLAGLALLVCVLAVWFWRRQLNSWAPTWVPFLGVGLLALIPLAKGIFFQSNNLLELGFVFALMVPLAVLSVRWAINTATLSLTIRVFTLVAVSVNVVQIALFFTTGRLPALGYENSTSVRFGSVFDDPNGFAILIPLLIPVVLLWTRIGFWRFVVIALLGISLILTQSFTGVAGAAASLCIGFVLLNWGKWKRLLIFVLTVGLIGAAAVIVLLNSATFLKVVETKAGSMEAHSGSLDVLFDLSVPTVLGLGQPLGGVESSYVSLVANLGLFYTVVYTALGIWAICRYYRAVRSAARIQDVAASCGFFFFLIGYMVTSINLQAEAMFPANLLYAVAIGVAFFVREDRVALATSGPVRASHRASRSGRRVAPRRALS